VTRVRLTHIGGPTTLLEVADWRILTDPTFDEPGRTYRFGLATSSRKTTGPAVPAAELGPIDVVLLGLRAWETTRLEAPVRPAIDVLATPCRHGPPLSRPLVGDVIGFALAWDAQEHGVLWISGDTVRYGGVRSVAERRTVSLAVLHLGEDPFPGHWAGALHDDRRRRRRALPHDPPAQCRPGALRGLVALPARTHGDRAGSGRRSRRARLVPDPPDRSRDAPHRLRTQQRPRNRSSQDRQVGARAGRHHSRRPSSGGPRRDSGSEKTSANIGRTV
jgi:hypothetical protein